VPHLSFSRHLLIAALLFLGVLAFIVVRNWDAVSQMVDNAVSMNEGAAAAQSIRSPNDLLTYIAQHPERVSLVAYDVDDPGAGVYYGADSVRATTRIAVLQLLAGYAQKTSADGSLRRVPLDSIAQYALPGVTAASYEQTLQYLESRGQIGSDSTVAVADLMGRVARSGGRAAVDWWMMNRGSDEVASLPDALSLPHTTAPRPLTGVTRLGRNQSLEALRRLSPAEQIEAAFAETHRLRDADVRARVQRQMKTDGSSLTLEQQRDVAQAIYPKGTARAYATLARGIAEGTVPSAASASVLHSMLERSVVPDSVDVPFASVATYGGAAPGVMSFVGYARFRDGRPPRVVVLLMDQMPIAVVYHLLQTGIDTGFQLQLLGDPDDLDRVRQTLLEASVPAS
jgi:hypothetical protein